MNELENKIKLYSAGATMIHNSFDDLVAYKNEFELNQDFLKNWVIPFYMQIGHDNSEFFEDVTNIKNNINKEIVTNLLGDFNWRTRQTGAYFAAVKHYSDLIDIIGVHLLKSEVCYAGQIYVIALAYFNTEKSVYYLNKYLDFYLTKPELWFDQTGAMIALKYLDEVNHTNEIEKHLDPWNKFLENKPYWKKEIETDLMKTQINFIKQIQLS